MLGNWQHSSFPIDHLDADPFDEGLGFDGSSIRRWMGIHESDMMALPDATTTRLDPFNLHAGGFENGSSISADRSA
jgi:glutamine synthetase